jgi:hypothetical protein
MPKWKSSGVRGDYLDAINSPTLERFSPCTPQHQVMPRSVRQCTLNVTQPPKEGSILDWIILFVRWKELHNLLPARAVISHLIAHLPKEAG